MTRTGPRAGQTAIRAVVGTAVIVGVTIAGPGAISSASGETSQPRPFTVVVDPGHGGSNVGAPGAAQGLFEKRLTLLVARALKRHLEPAGVRVVLTRDRDRYLTLRARGRRAAQFAADCFISLHANASPQHRRRGIETYVLAPEAVEVEARRAAIEAQSGIDGLVSEVERLERQRVALELARTVQRALVTARVAGPAARRFSSGSAAAAQDGGVRQAAYDVLSDQRIPAILVEMGFIDHPIEGIELARSDVQDRIARGLAEGLIAFRAARASTGTGGGLARSARHSEELALRSQGAP